MMIPKKIHYCWIGGNPLPELAIKCIESWKKYCPDYEIIEWNEKNYDFRKNQFMREAYDEKKWGFVPDYARLDIIYEHGGIYLDTDVEILQENPFERFLNYRTTLCFENARGISTGLFFASHPNSTICKLFLEPYWQMHYSKSIIRILKITFW